MSTADLRKKQDELLAELAAMVSQDKDKPCMKLESECSSPIAVIASMRSFADRSSWRVLAKRLTIRQR